MEAVRDDLVELLARPRRLGVRVEVVEHEQRRLAHLVEQPLVRQFGVLVVRGAQLIQQVRVIEGEVLLTTAGVSNQTNRTTAVRRLHRLRHISHDCAETSLAYHPQRGLPICHVSMFTQQAAIVRRST